MVEYYSRLSEIGGSDCRLFAGVTFDPNSAVAGICDERGVVISDNSCRGKLDLSKPNEMLTLTRNVIDNVIHVSPVPVKYGQINCIAVSVPEKTDTHNAEAFIGELRRIEPRIAGAHIIVLSDYEVIMHCISKDGNGLIINSGSRDIGFGCNFRGETEWVNGPGLAGKLAWEVMNMVVGGTSTTVGFKSLQSRFFDHFNVTNTEDLKDSIGFYDPIERPSVKAEILSVLAEKVTEGNFLAINLCEETARRYRTLSEPLITNLHLNGEAFPIFSRGDVFTVNPIFGQLYLKAVKCIAPNAYLTPDAYKMGLSEAQVALDHFACN